MTANTVPDNLARPANDRGSADVLGLLLIAPVVLGLAVLVLALGRGVDARAQVRSAASAAAQAAALERTPAAARMAAQSVARAMLIDRDTCGAPVVNINTLDFRSGGLVGVEVRCSVSNRGLETVQSRAFDEGIEAFATLDFFRSGESP